MEIMHYLSSPFVIFVTLFLFVLAWRTRSKKSNFLNLPPGPRKLPFIGNLHLLALSSILPHHLLRNLSLKYGPVMHLQLGEISTVVISSSESAKEVLKTHDLSFASRPSLLASEILLYGRKDIAFCAYSDYWRQMRKISVIELMSAKRVQSFRPIRDAVFLNFCRWIASNSGSPIHLGEKLVATGYDVVSGSSLGQEAKEHETFIYVLKRVMLDLAGLDVVDLYPSYKFLHLFSGLKGRLEKLHKESDRLLEDIIQQRKAAISTAANNSSDRNQEDLLTVLLKLQAEEDAGFQLEHIKAMIMMFFIAGSETSPTVVDWAMAEMLKKPTVLKKAQEEVRRVIDAMGGRVDESYLEELKYLKLVAKETLRLHPPGPLLIPRECRESCEVSGYRIPVKSRIMVNVWAIGRDPKYWEDPESFMPERFIRHNVDYKGNEFEFLPFGSGRRMCPGILYGLTVVETQLALLLYHFDWSLYGGMKPEDIDMTETSGLSAKRKTDLYVIPTVMRPLPTD